MHDNFLNLLAQALNMVPDRSLYYATIVPDYEAPNKGFRNIDFSFRISNQFCAYVPQRNGEFHTPEIHKNRYLYELYAIPFISNIGVISVEEAMKKVMLAELGSIVDPVINRALNEHFLWFFGEDTARHLATDLGYLVDEKVEVLMWELVDKHFSENWRPNFLGPFSSITLKKPFQAGVMEPYYYFELPFIDFVIMVGAHTGEVRYH